MSSELQACMSSLYFTKRENYETVQNYYYYFFFYKQQTKLNYL